MLTIYSLLTLLLTIPIQQVQVHNLATYKPLQYEQKVAYTLLKMHSQYAKRTPTAQMWVVKDYLKKNYPHTLPSEISALIFNYYYLFGYDFLLDNALQTNRIGYHFCYDAPFYNCNIPYITTVDEQPLENYCQIYCPHSNHNPPNDPSYGWGQNNLFVYELKSALLLIKKLLFLISSLSTQRQLLNLAHTYIAITDTQLSACSVGEQIICTHKKLKALIKGKKFTPRQIGNLCTTPNTYIIPYVNWTLFPFTYDQAYQKKLLSYQLSNTHWETWAKKLGHLLLLLKEHTPHMNRNARNHTAHLGDAIVETLEITERATLQTHIQEFKKSYGLFYTKGLQSDLQVHFPSPFFLFRTLTLPIEQTERTFSSFIKRKYKKTPFFKKKKKKI